MIGALALEALYTSVPWDLIFLTYICIFVDLFYGVFISWLVGDPTSRKMRKGLQSKMFVIFVPIMAIIIQAFFIFCQLPSEWAATGQIHQILGVVQLSDFPICILLCLFVILMELYSFLESSAKVNDFALKLLKLFNKALAKEIAEQTLLHKLEKLAKKEKEEKEDK